MALNIDQATRSLHIITHCHWLLKLFKFLLGAIAGDIEALKSIILLLSVHLGGGISLTVEIRGALKVSGLLWSDKFTSIRGSTTANTLVVVLVSKKATRFAIFLNVLAAGSRHSVKDTFRIWVASSAKGNLVLVVGIHLSRSETHQLQLFVGKISAHSFMSLVIVHILIHRREPTFGVVHDDVLLKGALVELIDITGVEMMCHVEHYSFLLCLS